MVLSAMVCISVSWLTKGLLTYTPEVLVRLVLRNPVRVHVLEQVIPTEWFQESANAGAIVRRYDCTVGQTIRGVG